MERERIIKTPLPAFQTQTTGGIISAPMAVPNIQRKRSEAEIRENWFGKERMKEATRKEDTLPVAVVGKQNW